MSANFKISGNETTTDPDNMSRKIFPKFMSMGILIDLKFFVNPAWIELTHRFQTTGPCSVEWKPQPKARTEC
jgi:hypothetical protein